MLRLLVRVPRHPQRPPNRTPYSLSLRSTISSPSFFSLSSTRSATFNTSTSLQAKCKSTRTVVGEDVIEEDEVQEVSTSHSTTNNQITLRPYQVECINAVLDELQKGQIQRLGVSAPTGSGKTSIFTHLISLLPALRHARSNTLATRVLIIVNSIQLATQTAQVIKKTWPQWDVEIEQGRSKASGLADVTVATFQTLARKDLERLDKFDPEIFKAVIIDEAHHAVAKSYLSILSRFDSEISDSLTSIGPSSRSHSSASSTSQSITSLDTLSPTASKIIPAPSPVTDSLETSSSDSSSASTRVSFNHNNNVSEDPYSTESFTRPLPTSPLPPLPAKLDSLERPRVPLLAFTATWTRADGLALGKVFQKIVWHAEWLDMIEGNWLSQLQFTTVRVSPSTLNLDNVDVSQQTGEFNLVSLAKEVDREEVNEIAVNAWLEKANDRRSTLVFAINIQHILTLTNTFRRHGIDARFVYQDTKPSQREEIYEQFRKGEFKVLVNCGILTEGADFPAIDCILLLRPTRSQTLFLQMIGRGLRLSPDTGKENCLVIDLVGSGSASGGVVCTPTLFGIDPDVEIDQQSPANLRELGQEQTTTTRMENETSGQPFDQDIDNSSTTPELSPFRVSHVHYKEYQTAFDYVSDTNFPKDDHSVLLEEEDDGQVSSSSSERKDRDREKPVHISRLSKLAWVGCGEDTWVLELMGKGHVKIVKSPAGYASSLYLKIQPSPFHYSQSRGAPLAPYMTPQVLAIHESLPLVLKTTDKYLRSKSVYSSLGIMRNAAWRNLEATDGQKNYIVSKLGLKEVEGSETGKNVTSSRKRDRVDESVMLEPGTPIKGRRIEGIWIGREYGSMVNVDELTKGQASDLISRTKHGGMGWWKKVKRRLERESRDRERVERKKVEQEMKEQEKAEKLIEREKKKSIEVGERLSREREEYEERRKANEAVAAERSR